MMAALVILLLLGQVPRDTAHATATGTLAGIVTSADSSHVPLRHARVTCAGPAAADAQTTVSDDQGQFFFKDLPAGRYTVRASSEGWVAMTYGARSPLGSGTPVTVSDHALTSIALRLPRASVIAGTLVDPEGLPVAGVTVRAFRFAGNGHGRRISGITAVTTTDDRGAYRLFGLTPGTYIVGADAARAGARFSSLGELHLATDVDVRDAERGVPAPPPRSVDYAIVYYPGTTAPSEANLIALGTGEEREGVDFAVQLVSTSRVSGSVSMPDGLPPPAGTAVTIAAFEPDGSAPAGFDDLRTARTSADGTFEFFNVPPGTWRIVARHAGAPPLCASTDIIADGGPIDGTLLTLSSGVQVSGRVVFADGAAEHPDASSVRVVLEPTARSAGLTAAVATNARPDGSFAITGALPGTYRLAATLPAQAAGRRSWSLRSSVLLGQETMDTAVRLGPDQIVSDAVVTFSDRMADVSGALAAPVRGDSRVVLFPTDPALYARDAPRIRSVVPAADGTYVFHAVLPGSYFVAVTDDPEPDAWRDPDVLRALAASASRVDVADRR